MIVNRRLRNRVRRRRGAVMVESAIVLMVFLFIMFGVFDLGMAALNSNNLKDIAQQITRAAVVRGSDASGSLTVWGPNAYSGNAALNDEIAQTAATSVLIMPLAQVKIVVEWPDGDCGDYDRVRATVSYTHPLITSGLFGYSSLPLKAVSTQRIAH